MSAARAIDLATNAGKLIVGIWPNKGPWVPIPLEFEKYGSALLPWDAEKICATLCSEELIWTEPDGRERSEGEVKRNKCRKKRAKHAAA